MGENDKLRLLQNLFLLEQGQADPIAIGETARLAREELMRLWVPANDYREGVDLRPGAYSLSNPPPECVKVLKDLNERDEDIMYLHRSGDYWRRGSESGLFARGAAMDWMEATYNTGSCPRVYEVD